MTQRPRKQRQATSKSRVERQSQINKNRQSLTNNKSRTARLLRHFQPDRMKDYWFSRRGLVTFLKLCGVGFVCLVIFVGIVSIELKKDIPAIKSLYGKNLGGSIKYYDRTGKVLLWTDYNAINRTPVSGSQMSPYIRDATVAIEDKNFYHEGPIDVGGILRSAFHDVFSSSHQLEGASTITQQLVKLNEGWNGDITIWRKVKEVFLAYDLSKEYSKSTILTGYLNIAPYGSVDYGIDAASEDYFHIAPSQLSLAQAAMLAAIPQSPSYYSPRSPDFSLSALKAREDYILYLMHQQGYITTAQETAAKAVNVVSEVQPPQGLYSHIIAPYFTLLAKQQLLTQFGTTTANENGWKVITTLSIPQQDEAQKLVAQNYANVANDGGNEEAMVTENVPTGQVTALVGGVNFYNPVDGQINYANVQINPGSTFKIYDYTTLIDEHNNVGAGSVLYDIQEPIPGYPCTNKALPLAGGNCLYDYDYQYPGPLTIRYAFAGSRNVPAVKAWLINGGAKTIAMAKAMGLTSGYHCYANNARTIPTKCYGSAAIGEGGYLRLDQTVNGFATDGRLGNYAPQTFILKITSDTGKTVYQWKQPPVDQVVRPDAAYIVDNILFDPAATYLPGYCGPVNCTVESQFGWKFQRTNGWDVSIKTGTTHDDESGLMIGMTTQYVVGSWVAYYTAEKPLIPHYGGLEGLTEPLTRGMITYLTANKKPINWTPPPGIKTLPAYVVNHPPAQVLGYYYGWEYPSPSMDIYPSWYVQPKGEGGSEVIDKVTGDLATACTPPLARETIYNNNANIFSIDIFYQGGGGAQYPKASANIHKCGDSPPSVTLVQNACDEPEKCTFTVSASQGTYPLSGGSYTSKPAGTISLLDNGKVIDSVNIPTNSGPTYSTVFQNVPVANGDQVSAEVVDSVLYSATSINVIANGVPGGAPATGTTPPPSPPG